MVCKENQDVTANGKTYKQKKTRGQQLCIEWKDKSTSWERFSDMKKSYPVDVAEYAEAVGISDEPAISWWTITEVCHLGHCWLSYGRCVMSGSPTGCLVGLHENGQTKQKIPEVYYMACFW